MASPGRIKAAMASSCSGRYAASKVPMEIVWMASTREVVES